MNPQARSFTDRFAKEIGRRSVPQDNTHARRRGMVANFGRGSRDRAAGANGADVATRSA